MGWRIDYFFVSEELRERVREACILPEVEVWDEAGSGRGRKIRDGR